MNDYLDYICHYGIEGQKWGVRRYQNKDGTLTELGKKRQEALDRYSQKIDEQSSKLTSDFNKQYNANLNNEDFINGLTKKYKLNKETRTQLKAFAISNKEKINELAENLTTKRNLESLKSYTPGKVFINNLLIGAAVGGASSASSSASFNSTYFGISEVNPAYVTGGALGGAFVGSIFGLIDANNVKDRVEQVERKAGMYK